MEQQLQMFLPNSTQRTSASSTEAKAGLEKALVRPFFQCKVKEAEEQNEGSLFGSATGQQPRNQQERPNSDNNMLWKKSKINCSATVRGGNLLPFATTITTAPIRANVLLNRTHRAIPNTSTSITTVSRDLGAPKGMQETKIDIKQEDSTKNNNNKFIPYYDIHTGKRRLPKGFENYPLVDIKAHHPNDVLMGRGGATNLHKGNQTWRKLVQSNKKQYSHLKKKRHKLLLSLSIVHAIRNQKPPGRFLQKMTTTADTHWWYDVGDKRAQEKTSQALREGPVHHKKKRQKQQLQEAQGNNNNNNAVENTKTKTTSELSGRNANDNCLFASQASSTSSEFFRQNPRQQNSPLSAATATTTMTSEETASSDTASTSTYFSPPLCPLDGLFDSATAAPPPTYFMPPVRRTTTDNNTPHSDRSTACYNSSTTATSTIREATDARIRVLPSTLQPPLHASALHRSVADAVAMRDLLMLAPGSASKLFTNDQPIHNDDNNNDPWMPLSVSSTAALPLLFPNQQLQQQQDLMRMTSTNASNYVAPFVPPNTSAGLRPSLGPAVDANPILLAQEVATTTTTRKLGEPASLSL